ncbi:MAG: DUF2585 domain-containing protein [Alphaproteobacteria bacterium]|nr:DUF2585 domain-containing protein [Alphaproteobacteria bacterium]
MKKLAPYIPVVAVLVMVAIVEYINGRVFICKCGYVKLWHGVVYSSENSQHIADWYSLSHIIHGFIFFGLCWLLLRKWAFAWQLLMATAVEGAWELFENSAFIINRYREATISLDYFGDSIINSVSDMGFMILGFSIAAKLPWRITVTTAIIMELLALYVIRDNLSLNVLMLLYPVETIKTWQAGA